MTKVTIDRELLEQVASEFEHDNDRYMLGRELRKILDAPRHDECDEPVAWMNPYGGVLQKRITGLERETFTIPLYTAPRQPEGMNISQCYEYECRIAELRRELALSKAALAYHSESASERDAQRAIAELREECERLRCDLEGEREQARDFQQEHYELQSERDTLRQQLAERDATIERLEAGIPRIQEQSHQMRQQRDKLADILRDLVPGCKWRFMRPRIDAALAEIDHDNE